MRVIAGQFKGRKLFAGNDQSIRPTTDRIKEYIFSVLQEFVADKEVADCFCGSGSLGIEALSRGASHVTFVENSGSSIEVLKQNLIQIGIPSRSYTIIQASVEEYARTRTAACRIIFMDPPFHYPTLPSLVESFTANEIFLPGDLLLIEHETINPLPKAGQAFSIFRQKKMGRSLISFIEKRIS